MTIKPKASITINKVGNLSKKELRRIIRWLIIKAIWIYRNRRNLSSRFSAKYW